MMWLFRRRRCSRRAGRVKPRHLTNQDYGHFSDDLVAIAAVVNAEVAIVIAVAEIGFVDDEAGGHPFAVLVF